MDNSTKQKLDYKRIILALILLFLSATVVLTMVIRPPLVRSHVNPISVQSVSVKPKSDFPININTATAEQLCTLDGIGEVKAAAIIEFRIKNGDFLNVDELANVKGIGPKVLDKIRDKICV